MTEFRCSAIINGVEHVNYIEIPERELEPVYPMHDEAKADYRKNVIEKHMNKWVLSLFKLSWEEVKQDEGNADCTDSSITQSKTTKGAS